MSVLIDKYSELFRDDFESILNKSQNKLNESQNKEIDFKIRELIEYMMYHPDTPMNRAYIRVELHKLDKEINK